jgi:hypothetical protein
MVKMFSCPVQYAVCIVLNMCTILFENVCYTLLLVFASMDCTVQYICMSVSCMLCIFMYILWVQSHNLVRT